jgi:8-oxo-dGTP diphosphatase
MIKKRHQNIPASYLILIKDNKVLLQRRLNTGYKDGEYVLPSGHVEKEESFTKALIREMIEEIGIILKPEDLKVAHIMHRKSEFKEERIDTFFIAEQWENEIQNMEPEKCDDLSWFPMDNLPDNIIDYIKFVFEKIENKIFYSEYGWEK